MKFVKVVFILTFILVFIVACTNTETDKNAPVTGEKEVAKSTPEKTATPDELATGRKIYSEHCIRCHKDDGTGGEVEVLGEKVNADDLTTEKMKKMSDEKYTKYIVNGIPSEGMPSFKDKLNDDEVKEVIKFIRKEIQK